MVNRNSQFMLPTRYNLIRISVCAISHFTWKQMNESDTLLCKLYQSCAGTLIKMVIKHTIL